MEAYQVHIIILFISFAIAIIVLIDGVTYATLAHPEVDDTESGRAAWINLIMYEITVPVFSIFGLATHILGLHLGFLSYVSETTFEAVIVVFGTFVHGAAWLTIGSLWTACDIGTISLTNTISQDGVETRFISRTGPAFCPQNKLSDLGFTVNGPIPAVRVAFSWIMLVLSLASLVCVGKGWNSVRWRKDQEEMSRRRRTMQAFEMASLGTGPGKGWVVPLRMGGYESKV